MARYTPKVSEIHEKYTGASRVNFLRSDNKCDECGVQIGLGYSCCNFCVSRCLTPSPSKFPVPKKPIYDEHDFGLYPKAYREYEDSQ